MLYVPVFLFPPQDDEGECPTSLDSEFGGAGAGLFEPRAVPSLGTLAAEAYLAIPNVWALERFIKKATPKVLLCYLKHKTKNIAEPCPESCSTCFPFAGPLPKIAGDLPPGGQPKKVLAEAVAEALAQIRSHTH